MRLKSTLRFLGCQFVLGACALLLLRGQAAPSAQKQVQVLASSQAASAPQPAAKPLVDRDTFRARDKNETILHVPRAGRYSLQVRSGQGTAIELVDRMAGPIGSDGAAGEADGRLDIILDKGDYKVRLLSPVKGTGEVTLKVLPFAEAQPVADAADHPMLTELDLVATTLADLQQRSYWIELKKRRPLILEVQGRTLSECRLWKDGALWEELEPTLTVYEPLAGRPMTHVEFHHDLNPGLYLLSCYGGKPRPWAEENGEMPLYLRWGIPRIGESGQRLFTVSPFGRDVFLVGKETNFFQLVRADKKPSQLTARRWDANSPRFGPGATAAIGKESRDPWCKVLGSGGSDEQLAIAQAAPGDSLELDYFKQAYWYEIRDLGARYWISSIHSAEGRDALDVSAILFNSMQKTPVQQSVPLVGPGKPLVRRVNLLDTDNLFLFIESAGTYVIDENKAEGASAQYQITPFMIFRPANYREPPFLDPGRDWVLAAGYHVLTLSPRSRGIIHFALRQKADLLGDALKSLLAGGGDPLKAKPGAPRLGFCWPDVVFDRYSTYTLVINQRANVESGIVFRQLPLQLGEPLPVTLAPGQGIPIQARIDRPSTIAVAGGAARLSSSGSLLAEGTVLQPGEHALSLQNTGQQTLIYNLRTVAVPVPPARPVVKKIEALLPMIQEGTPRFVDYKRGQTREFLLRVREPGIYRLETSGLLATAIRVRSFLTSALFNAEENGIGRNALVQQYLKPGDYVVAVQARGRSMGRAGLHLRRTPVEFSDELAVGNVSRKRVPADAALRYRLQIPQKGLYRLETLGLGKIFTYRLEEEGGWPLVLSEQAEFCERNFEAGTHFYYSLPEPVASRRVSTVRLILEPKPIRGKGPHLLELNKPIENVWMETPDRKPDFYTVAVAAPISARLTVEKDLEALLLDGKNVEVACTRRGEWEGDLAAGQYRIQVRSVERTNRLPYTVSLATDDFIPGMVRTVSALPATLEVSLGESGLAEFSSFGRQDCRATLLEKATGARIAAADDMPADWNFLISRELRPGRYQLFIESMTPETVSFEVRLAMRRTLLLAEKTVPFKVNEKIGRDILKIPFRPGPAGELLHVRLQQKTPLQMALHKEGIQIAESQDEIFIPLSAGGGHALLVWQHGDQSGEVRLSADSLPAPRLSVSREMALDGFRSGRVESASGCGLQATAAGQPLLFSSGLDQPCLPQGGAGEQALIGNGWLALPRESRLQLSPLVLKPEKEESLRLGTAPLPFAIEKGAAPMLLECESAGSLVGLRIDPVPAGAAGPFPWAGLHIERGRTLAGIPETGAFRGEIRKLESEASTAASERVSLRLQAFPLQATLDLPDAGDREMELKAGRSLKLATGRETAAVDLVLPEGVAAFSWAADRPFSLAAAMDGNGEARLPLKPGFLYIVNRGESAVPVRVRRAPAEAAAEFTLDPQKGMEKVFNAPGRVRLSVSEIGADRYVCLFGEEVSGYFLGDDGRLVPAKKMKCLGNVTGYAGGRGLLVVDHGPGLVKIWVSPEGQVEKTMLGDLKKALGGKWQNGIAVLENALQKWAIQVPETSALFFTFSSPLAWSAFQDDKPLVYWFKTNEDDHFQFLLPDKGDVMLYTRPLAGRFAEGKVVMKRVPPQAFLPPGPDKDLLISSGEIQAFRFPVKVKGKVGIGLRCESDQLQAWLFDSGHNLLATGPLMIRELEAGEYFLVVGGSDSPVRFRPVILGSEGSLQGIPDDVLRSYLNKEKADEE